MILIEHKCCTRSISVTVSLLIAVYFTLIYTPHVLHQWVGGFLEKWWRGIFWVGLENSIVYERLLGRVKTMCVLQWVFRFLYPCAGHIYGVSTNPLNSLSEKEACSENILQKQISLAPSKNKQLTAQLCLLYLFPERLNAPASRRNNYTGFWEMNSWPGTSLHPSLCEKGKLLGMSITFTLC